MHQQDIKSSEAIRIGTLYDFALYVRPHSHLEEINDKWVTQTANQFYAQRESDGIKYTYNSGFPNTDNPKLAARYFLNAIDQISTLTERHKKEVDELNKDIPMVQKILEKPFEKDSELKELKIKVENLEREIATKITENQMKENGSMEALENNNSPPIEKEIPILKMVAEKEMNKEVCAAIIEVEQREPRIKRRIRF